MSSYTDKMIAVFSLITLIYGGYLFLENRFENIVSTKLFPYQKLLIAQSLDDEKAIDAFSDALEVMLKEKVDDKLLSSVITPYLSAIANVDKPYKYQHHTAKLVKLLNNKVSIDYDTSNSLGWIYLQLSENKKAEEYFTKSISFYKQADLINISSSAAYQGLTLTYLTNGDIDNAIKSYNSAWEHDYQGYNPQRYISDDLSDVPWFKKLVSIYPMLGGNYKKLHDYLKSTYKLSEKIEQKALDKNLLDSL